MAEHNEHVASIVAGALSAVADEPPEVRAAVASSAAQAAAEASMPAPVGAALGTIWIILVSALAAVLATTAAMIGAYTLVQHTGPPDAVITIFTSTLTGLVGLFVRTPAQK